MVSSLSSETITLNINIALVRQRNIMHRKSYPHKRKSIFGKTISTKKLSISSMKEADSSTATFNFDSSNFTVAGDWLVLRNKNKKQLLLQDLKITRDFNKGLLARFDSPFFQLDKKEGLTGERISRWYFPPRELLIMKRKPHRSTEIMLGVWFSGWKVLIMIFEVENQ